MIFGKYLFINKSSQIIFSNFIAVMLLISYPAEALAQDFIKSFLASIGFQRDRKGYVGGRVKGGAGRGNCPANTAENDKQLIALIPSLEGETNEPSSKTDKSSSNNDKPSSKDVFSYTIKEKPNLWFYIPHTYDEKSQLKYAKLAIIDEEKRLVTEPRIFRLPDHASIAQVKLPINLEVNKRYKWFFSIVCDENKPSRNPSVSGWIERVDPRVVKFPPEQSEKKLTLIPYRTMARRGLWWEAFTKLASEKLEKSGNNLIQNDWLKVFEYLELNDKELVDEISQADIYELNCVSTPDSTCE